MKITKITSLVLAIVMLMSLFVSCDTASTDPKTLQANAALKLLEAPYIMTIKMNYSSNNEEVNEILSMSSGTEISMNMDGTNFIMTMSVMGQGVEYLFHNNVIYMEMMGMKMKSKVDKDEVEELLGDGMTNLNEIGVEGFESITVDTKDGITVITCKGFKSKTTEVIDSLIEGLNEFGDEAEVNINKDDFEYIIAIDKDGRFKSIDMTFGVGITVEGENVTVTYDAEMDFDYEKAVKVTAPEDADQYMDADGLLG